MGELERYQKGRGGWSATGAGTNAGVTVTKAAVAGQVHVLQECDFSGDAACVVTIESPASTVLWRKRFAAAFNVAQPNLEIRGAVGQDLLVKISASTANSEANFQGYSV